MKPFEVIGHCGGLCDYEGPVYRLVESQEEAATYALVDDLEEQAVLEDILEDFKPPYPEDVDKYDYLIKTPFRYPPLKHGSRFGTRAEASYFYASEDEQTCLAEAAFYRFVFFDGMETAFPDKVHSAHQLFSVHTKTDKLVDLTQTSDVNAIAELTSKASYAFSQAVGGEARKAGAQVIRFISARANEGVNVAIDTPTVITSTKPENITAVQCETLPSGKILRFSLPRQFPVTFRIEQFYVDGRLPYPAA